jgi:hypothetical protein
MATDAEKIAEYPKLIDQLCLAINVYADIEVCEREHDGEIPEFIAEDFKRWREWRIKNGLERRKK